MKNLFKRWGFWIGLGVLTLALLVYVVGFNGFKPTPKKLPPIQTNFIDVNYLQEISFIRSCDGHVKTAVSGHEPKSNMGHYFFLRKGYWEEGVKNRIPVYSPYDGFAYPHGNEIRISLEKVDWNTMGGKWFILFDHVQAKNGLQSGQSIKAGEIIGYQYSTEGGNGFDVIVARMAGIFTGLTHSTPYQEMDSVFNYMPDDIFALYQAKGIASRNQMTLSKDYRLAHPCQLKPKSIYFVENQKQEDMGFKLIGGDIPAPGYIEPKDPNMIDPLPANTCPDSYDGKYFHLKGEKVAADGAVLDWINANCPNIKR